MKSIKIRYGFEIPENFTGIVEWDSGSKYWLKEGEYHRLDGPAVEQSDGTKGWYKEGKQHREDGPACEYPNGAKYWYKEGKQHREDGPACELSNGDRLWYLENKIYQQINLQNYVVLDYDKGKYGIMWYKLLTKNKIIEYPDIPGLITK